MFTTGLKRASGNVYNLSIISFIRDIFPQVFFLSSSFSFSCVCVVLNVGCHKITFITNKTYPASNSQLIITVLGYDKAPFFRPRHFVA